MGTLDVFRIKPNDKLSHKEEEVVKILHNIFIDFKINATSYWPDDIEIISMRLYILAFHRAYKNMIRLEEALVFNNAKATKFIAIYTFIEDTIIEMCQDPLYRNEPVSLDDFSENLNYLLHATAYKIREV